MPKNDLAPRIFFHTRQLIRRQRTWFRHQLPADFTADAAELDPEKLRDRFLCGHCGGVPPASAPVSR
jgi:tRNA A37 N6-isopentenylltransferase MiaA